MARALRASLLAAALAATASAAGPEVIPSPAAVGVEQKWGFPSLEDLKEQATSALESAKSSNTWNQVKDMADSAADQAKALADKGFNSFVASTNVCEHLHTAIAGTVDPIAGDLAQRLSTMEADPAEEPKACMAVADQTANEGLEQQIQGGFLEDMQKKATMLVVQGFGAELCNGTFGIHEWLVDNAQSKVDDAEGYATQLKTTLVGKVAPILNNYTDSLCNAATPEETGLFQVFSAPITKAMRSPAVTGIFVALAAVTGLAFVLVARRSQYGNRDVSSALADAELGLNGGKDGVE